MSDPHSQYRGPTSSAPSPAVGPHYGLRSLFVMTAVVATLVAGAKSEGVLGAYFAAVGLCFVTWIWATVTRRRDISRTALRFFVYGTLCAVLLAILLPPSIGPRPASPRTTCMNNLRNLGQALRAYENEHGSFPPVYTTDQNGKPLLSWRTSIMPHIDRIDIYAHYRADEPWNSPANNRFTQIQLELLKCPSSIAVAGNNLTSYVALISPGGAWIPGRGLKLSEIKDDPHDTILLVEMRNSDIPWAEPRDLDLNNLPAGITPQNFLDSIANHPSIVNVLFAEGSIQSIPTTIPWQDFLALLTIAGGETIDRSKW